MHTRSALLAPDRAALLGMVLALGSASAFGAITTFARIAYEAGSNPLTVLVMRFAAATLVFGAICVLLGRPLRLPPDARAPVALTGIAWFVGAGGYLGSVHFIPVGLAAIIFFTFPILVALLTMLSERRRVGVVDAALLIMAFAGLALALGPSFGTLDPIGIGLAFAGACGAAGQFFCSREVVRRCDVVTVLVFVNLTGSVLALGLLVAAGAWALPSAQSGVGFSLGWGAFIFAMLAYVAGVFLMYGAIRNTGPARSAMFFNLEPMISIGIAAMLLGERLSGLQFVGGALVLSALVASSRRPVA